MTTKEQRKEQAIKLMKKLNIFAPYIKGFKEKMKYVSMKIMLDFGHFKMKNF